MPKPETFHGWTADQWRAELETDHTQKSLISQDLHRRPGFNPFDEPTPRDLDFGETDALVTELVMASIDWTNEPTSDVHRASVRAVIVKLAQKAGLIA